MSGPAALAACAGVAMEAWIGDDDLADLERLARLLDARWRIPGTGVRFGVDALLGLIPGAGDTLALLPGLYIVYRGARLGVGAPTIALMLLDVGVDWLLGSIPLLGDLFDLGWQANRRNVARIRRALGRVAPRPPVV